MSLQKSSSMMLQPILSSRRSQRWVTLSWSSLSSRGRGLRGLVHFVAKGHFPGGKTGGCSWTSEDKVALAEGHLPLPSHRDVDSVDRSRVGASQSARGPTQRQAN
ncbi:hypothetical protein GWK47_039698 [Chionoecetes opilio]|uniref:Uncharacterized protein n=1 Tax=Chionoecetes opilio TaxID=41210 RepID=A0A8J4YK85_CHIOP|nr:hypothetical protein GWK47_039698 [Chionoecetes opilio]